MQGLRYAPLAALVAVIAPEIVLTDGALLPTWADARLYAVLVGTAYFWWRRGILGTIVSGTAVLLSLKIGPRLVSAGTPRCFAEDAGEIRRATSLFARYAGADSV